MSKSVIFPDTVTNIITSYARIIVSNAERNQKPILSQFRLALM